MSSTSNISLGISLNDYSKVQKPMGNINIQLYFKMGDPLTKGVLSAHPNPLAKAEDTLHPTP
jgi:hypothetical protein